MWRLSDDDGRVVDLLLNASVDNQRATGGNGAAPATGLGTGLGDGNGGSGLSAAAATTHSPQRFQALETLLSTLNHLPVIEPPSQLVTATLKRIAASAPWEGAPPIADDRPPAPDAAEPS